VGQGVLVGATGITITDMAFYLNMPSGGDLKFMIWDSTDANLLFSSVLSGVGLSEIPSWVSSSPFSFTLQANTEYWFGIIADNNMDVGYISTPIGYSANGLTADTGGNSNYSTFANPTFYNKGGAEIGLQLSGGGVPEPGSISRHCSRRRASPRRTARNPKQPASSCSSSSSWRIPRAARRPVRIPPG